MDECGVSQQVMQENPNSFFFLNTHCEIYSKEASMAQMSYSLKYLNRNQHISGRKNKADDFHKFIILDRLPKMFQYNKMK